MVNEPPSAIHNSQLTIHNSQFDMANLKMIVGLGNPGPQYAANRHNLGFQCVDLFAARHGVELGKLQLQARTGEGWVTRGGERQKVLLVKPLTYMNASGQAVGALMRYYRVALEEMIVVHDDLDLASGRLRLRMGGGAGGQNGVKSLIQHLGSPDFARLRIGIGRPPGQMDPAAYVLQNFSADEEAIFGPLRLRVCDALTCWLFEGLEAAMNLYNRAADNGRAPVMEAPSKPATDQP
jgi:PTH1 family peptidyl-tRNA hydrolase